MAEATIRDVAKYAGVGVGTVSRVLNDSPSVSTTTRRKVELAIKALDYSPNLAARRLSRGKTMALGVVVPFFTNPSVIKRLQGIISVLAGSEYDLVLFDVEKTANRDALFHNIIRRDVVDGLLIISLHPNDDNIQQMLDSDIPGVMIDASHPWLSRIVVDNVAGGRMATEHLIGLGHRKIAYINDLPEKPFKFAPPRDRYKGYKQALRSADIPLHPEYYREGSLDRHIARDLTTELLTLPDPPTAVFAYSDTQATGVLEAATALEYQVPEDLSVMGFDDIELAEYLHLSTVCQSLFESGVRGGELLLETLLKPDKEPVEILLETKLVPRNTTGPPGR